MKAPKKYSLELDEALVRSAVKATGMSFTETVRQGLKILAAADAYRELSKMKGAFDLELDARKLRREKRDLR